MHARRPTGEGAPGCGDADLAIAARVSAAGLIWLSIAFWSNERSIAGFLGLCAFAPSAAAAEITCPGGGTERTSSERVWSTASSAARRGGLPSPMVGDGLYQQDHAELRNRRDRDAELA